MQRFGLSAKGIEPGFVKISCGKLRIPIFRKAPWPIVETFAGYVDVVGVQYAMNKARCHVGRSKISDAFDRQRKQLRRWVLRQGDIIELCQAICDQLLHEFRIALSSHTLEAANADMAVA